MRTSVTAFKNSLMRPLHDVVRRSYLIMSCLHRAMTTMTLTLSRVASRSFVESSVLLIHC